VRGQFIVSKVAVLPQHMSVMWDIARYELPPGTHSDPLSVGLPPRNVPPARCEISSSGERCDVILIGVHALALSLGIKSLFLSCQNDLSSCAQPQDRFSS
jgi:hypothetical protein